jgi:AAA15 family ATPase/GTPase
MISSIELENFTLFHELNVDLNPGINIIIGENGTGKTQLLKAAYAASSTLEQIGTTSLEEDRLKPKLTERLVSIFKPLDDKLGKLHRSGAEKNAKVKVKFSNENELALSFYNNSQGVVYSGEGNFSNSQAAPVFIPTKEVLSFMKGFSSLYQRYGLSFDQTYQDICISLDLPEIRNEQLQEKSKWAISEINAVVGGQFVFSGGGKVIFKSENNEYSANVVAEGFRKAGMLARLLETGVIQPGISGTLFWDEPESNLNPKLMEMLVSILLELSRNGLQIVLATHDYVFLKWFDLLVDKNKGDQVRYHALYKDKESKKINIEQSENFKQLAENAISDSYSDLTKAQVKKNMGGLGQ